MTLNREQERVLSRARSAFRDALAGRVRALERAIELTLSTGARDRRREAYRLAHSLAGTAGTLGEDRVALLCAALEQILLEAPDEQLEAALVPPLMELRAHLDPTR